ncbi:MAG: hypothetical protein JJLCMIEE_00577 [Acidimicrobiales bacterium]|nr:MAG: hypothetical protein EDR02_04455 [Actinomycetota bacterium]MBV6507528.1 hypothetical protein [Acidimicrobiales bacterium]RIK07901.1 MAG: hypothetical protein DCC48_02820 [Acidobacteriota bacterium]
MVAFLTSVAILIVLVAPIPWYAKRRPVGTPLTWGEALLAATYVFLILFWLYGVVPHQWLDWADNELNWRPDRILIGPGGEYWTTFPITISYQVIRDVAAVIIYGIALVGNVWFWIYWQNRGQRAEAEPSRSTFGRPLVKEG